MKKRILALFLALALCLALVPATALAANVEKLPTPTNVEWGQWSHYDENENHIDGYMNWSGSFDGDFTFESSEIFTVKLYTGTNELVDTYANARGYEFILCSDNYESGDYYFTVQSMATDDAHSDSDVATSSVWTYVKPASKVAAPKTAPEWDDEPEFGWCAFTYYFEPVYYENFSLVSDEVAGYFEEVRFSKTNGSITDHNDPSLQLVQSSILGYYDGSELPSPAHGILKETVAQFGSGYYYVHVFTTSRDITKNRNSDWSPLSAAFYYKAEGETPSSPKPSESAAPSMTPSAAASATPSTTPSTQPSTTPSTTPSATSSTKPSSGSSSSRPSGGDSSIAAKPVAVTGVRLNKTAAVTVGGTAKLTATVTPSNAADKGVYWTSDDTYVVTVDANGTLTGVKEGKANVTVTTVDGGFSATCAVTVTKTTGSIGGGGGGGSIGGGGAVIPPATIPASEKFTDVAKDSWYEAGVTFVVAKGLFLGVAEGVFAPQTNMTRAMLMTVLARLDGQSTEGGDTWYQKAMDWAVAQGISDGTMAESSVTREQLVTMLYRYAKADKTQGDLSTFADAAGVTDWAKAPMTWAVDKGILTGKGNSTLDPQGTATRAEVATILKRFVESK